MIYFVGDTHGDFEYLNIALLYSSFNDSFIICGDFGYWIAKYNSFYHHSIINLNHSSIYWIDGNHEDYNLIKQNLDMDSNVPYEMERDIYYCPRGSEIELEGKKILFFGGASSIDKHHRTTGYSWFPEENIRYTQLEKLDRTKKYDIIVSHTCPKVCLQYIGNKLTKKIYDLNTECLQTIYDMYRPKYWYFGHWHEYNHFETNGTVFTCCGRDGDSNHIIMHKDVDQFKI